MGREEEEEDQIGPIQIKRVLVPSALAALRSWTLSSSAARRSSIPLAARRLPPPQRDFSLSPFWFAAMNLCIFGLLLLI
uniref:Uncharacterized protein n=1 Tax=Oryza glumipatula TaxID=40148 RepID=A0A0E0B0R1_9ORYZ